MNKTINTLLFLTFCFSLGFGQSVVQINDSLYQIVSKVQTQNGAYVEEGSPYLKKDQIKDALFNLALQRSQGNDLAQLPEVEQVVQDKVIDAIQGKWELDLGEQTITGLVEGDKIKSENFEGNIYVLNEEEFLIRGLFTTDAIINYKLGKGLVGNVSITASNKG